MLFGRPGLDWTVVLRRRPARLVGGEPEGGYTDVFEIICCYCGDDPDLDYREVCRRIQRIRGPYPIVTGIAAYKQHLAQHPAQGPARQGPPRPDGAVQIQIRGRGRAHGLRRKEWP